MEKVNMDIVPKSPKTYFALSIFFIVMLILGYVYFSPDPSPRITPKHGASGVLEHMNTQGQSDFWKWIDLVYKIVMSCAAVIATAVGLIKLRRS